MNEYPNSVWNNMVNTNPNYTDNYQAEDYKIEILNEPENDKNYEMDRTLSKKIRQAIVIGSVTLAALAGTAYVSYRQHQSMVQNTAVVQTVELPGDATLNITENPSYSYIETSDGRHVSEYNGMNAQELSGASIAQDNGKTR